MSMMYFDLKKEMGPHRIHGSCASCKKTVYETLATLDDAYNVWCGKCPHCGAYNLLALTGLRGYSSQGMDLVLPTDEEKKSNNMPEGTITSGPCGKPADIHGSVSGELGYQLLKTDHATAPPPTVPPSGVWL